MFVRLRVYAIPPVTQTSVNFSTYVFSADITTDMLKLCRVTNKKKVLFLVLGYVFHFNLLEFLTPILEKCLLLHNAVHDVRNYDD